MQAILNTLMEKHFELRTTIRRETDAPWINNRLRWLFEKSRKIYNKEGRSAAWKKLRKKTSKLYEKRPAKYMEGQKTILTSADAAASFYKNVWAYKSREKTKSFDPRDLYPEKPDHEIAEALAGHFNAINSELNGLDSNLLPERTPQPSLPPITRDQVRMRLVSFKKPKSKVLGDIFPALVNRAANDLSYPLVDIYNQITVTGEWLAQWKVEYVTPIPKKAAPEGPDDLRNISCTQLLSKIY